MILALSTVYLLVTPIESFQFGPRYVHPLRSSLRNAQPSGSESSENVRIQHKRSDGAPQGHYVGARGVDGSFLNFKEAPAKLVEAREHGQATLQCAVAGSPAPSVAWYKDGEPVVKAPKVMFHPGHELFQIAQGPKNSDEEEQKSLGVAIAKLELGCVTEADAGYYECVATQGENTESVSTEVHVVSFGAGNCQPKTMHTSPPKISQSYQTYMIEMGLSAHLKCLTVGPHSTTWIGPDDETISQGDKFKILPDGSLIIRDLEFNDMGVYVCTVKNQFGHDMAETFVYPVAPMY